MTAPACRDRRSNGSIFPASSSRQLRRARSRRRRNVIERRALSGPGLCRIDRAEPTTHHVAKSKILYCTGLVDSLFDEVKTLWAHEAFIEKPISVQGLLEAVTLMLFDHPVSPATVLHTAKINASSNARP